MQKTLGFKHRVGQSCAFLPCVMDSFLALPRAPTALYSVLLPIGEELGKPPLPGTGLSLRSWADAHLSSWEAEESQGVLGPLQV